MPASVFRTIVTLVLLFHGVGHVMGVIPMLKLFGTESGTGPAWFSNWSGRSWLLTGTFGDAAARFVGAVLFLGSFLGFVAAALGLVDWLVPHGLWRTIATASAVVSLFAVALCWNAFIYVVPHKVGAIGVDLAVLVCLIWLRWPSEQRLGY